MANSAANLSDNLSVFRQSIQSLFDSWTCLQLAVKHGFGGPHSMEKEKWMVDAVFNWFNENADIEPYELEDFLADILDHEFDTIADDGSLSTISTNICTNYQLCKSGQYQAVLEKIKKTPSARLGDCVADDAEGMEEDDMGTSSVQDANMQAMLGGMRLGQSHDQSYDQASTSTSSSSAAAVAAATHTSIPGATSESSTPSNAEEDDGWTVVRKSKKK